MARFEFGGSSADVVWSSVPGPGYNFVAQSIHVVAMWDSETGGTQYTDLLDAFGNPVTTILPGVLGVLPRFSGPDGVTEMWADAGVGRRVRLMCRSNDGVIAGRILDPASATVAALDGRAKRVFGVGAATGSDWTRLTNAIAAASSAGGGVVTCQPGQTYVIGAELVLKAKVVVDLNGSTIQLANGVNSRVVVTENYDTLRNTNKWLVSDGVPTGFGLINGYIDGNKANNPTGGHGVAIYGKRYTIDNLIVHDCHGDGFHSECAYQGGQTETDDLPESEIGTLYVRSNDGNGITYLGPHDGHIGSVYPVLNGGHGFYNATSNGTGGAYYNGQCDIDFMHTYANALDGAQFNSPTSIGNIQTESNQQRGLCASTARSVRAGLIYTYRNWSQYSAGSMPAGCAEVEIAAGAMMIQGMRVRADYGDTGVKITTSGGVSIGTLSIDGMLNTFGGVGLSLEGNHISIGSGVIQGFTAAGGIGASFNDGLDQVQARLVIFNNATQVRYLGTTGNRLNLDLAGFVAAGQVGISGSLAGTVGRVAHQFGGAGTGADNNTLLSNSAWNAGHPMIGGNHLWVDGTGALRIKSSAPTGDTDGALVGSTVPVALTTDSGTLGSNVALAAGVPSTVLTTSSLAAGKWRIDAQITVNVTTASTSANVQANIASGPSGYTVSGASAAQVFVGSSATVANQTMTVNLTFFATITTPGAIAIQARCNSAANAVAVTPTTSYAGATGYTATKVA